MPLQSKRLNRLHLILLMILLSSAATSAEESAAVPCVTHTPRPKANACRHPSTNQPDHDVSVQIKNLTQALKEHDTLGDAKISALQSQISALSFAINESLHKEEVHTDEKKNDGAKWKNKIIKLYRSREDMEKLYFIANYILVLIAFIGGAVALKQLTEATKARRSNVYLQTTDDWNGDRATESRMYFIGLEEKYFDLSNTSDPIKNSLKENSPQEYICQTLIELEKSDKLKARRCLVILTMMENLGVLCKGGNIATKEVAETISGQVKRQIELLMSYIRHRQKSNAMIFENAIWLYDFSARYWKKGERREKRRLWARATLRKLLSRRQ